MTKKITKREANEMRLINCILYDHKLPVCVALTNKSGKCARWPTGAYTIYELMPYAAGVRRSEVRAVHEEIQGALADYRGDARLKVRFGSHPFSLEVPRRELVTLVYETDVHERLQEFEAVLGRSYAYGKPHTHTVYLPDPNDAHMLFAGRTGSGKSMMMQAAIIALANNASPERLQFIMIDLKSRDLRPFQDLPHVRAWTDDEIEAEQLIAWCAEEVNRRKREGEDPPATRIIIAIDELAELAACNIDMAGLERVARMGRSLGVHIIAAAQKPDRSLIGGQLRSQFTVKAVGLVENGQDAQLITGRKASGAEHLPGKGAMMLIRDGAEPVRIQGYYIEDAAPFVQTIKQRWDGMHAEPIHATDTQSQIDMTDHRLLRDAERAWPVFAANYDPERGKMRHGTKKILIEAIFGEGAENGGANNHYADRVIEHLAASR